MKYQYFIIIALLLLALNTVPASAFTAKNLDITIRDNGDANIDFQYQLTWAERFSAKFVPNKEGIITSALGKKFPKMQVNDISVSDTNTVLTVKKFASVSTLGGTTKYKTPAVSFIRAREIMQNVPVISSRFTPDFSPEVTTVKFPGGQKYTYYDATGIPSIAG